MNRLYMATASALLAASTAASGLLLAGPASASAAHRAAPAQQAVVRCVAAHHNYGFPSKPTTYGAGAAGSVTVAPVNAGTIKVTAVHPARGYRAFVDSGSGSSVDVYFHNRTSSVKFEAEINDSGGLTVTVTTCRR
jgi:hypothetical protein